jgi:hypothetical protein
MSQPFEASRLSNLAARSVETPEQLESCSGKAGAQVSQSQPRAPDSRAFPLSHHQLCTLFPFVHALMY